jgi:hypothetical protein
MKAAQRRCDERKGNAMNRHYYHPFRIDDQAVMLSELHLRELHRRSAERRLATSAVAAQRPVTSRIGAPRWRPGAWLGTRLRAALLVVVPLAE